jgi:16S rRNA (guanine966-N2)-methyltransferase
LRIISGTRKGLSIQVPAGLPVRPTTERAKESIFNILETHYDLGDLLVLDLFSGTGSMAFEFASRGAAQVVCVDADIRCVKHLKATQQKYTFENVEVVKNDVFRFLKQPSVSYDLIFADPPYDLPGIDSIAELVFAGNFLNPGGTLIVEHHSKTFLSKGAHFSEERVYGQSTFTFYKVG